MSRVHALAFGLVLLVGFGLRLAYLDQPLGYDEAKTYLNSVMQPPLFERLYDLSDPNNHPLNTLLMAASVRIFATNTEWALRVPTFFAGVLLIPAAYSVGRKLYTADAGLLAAALVAISPPLIFFATNARGYTLVALCFLLLIQSPNIRWKSLIIALGSFTTPGFVFPLAVWGVWQLWGNKNEGHSVVGAGLRTRPLQSAFVILIPAALITLALYFPVMLNSSLPSWPRGIAPADVISSIPRWFSTTLRVWTYGAHPVVIVPIVIGIGLAAVKYTRVTLRLAAALLIGVCGVALLVRPPGLEGYARLLLFALPLVWIAAAGGFTTITQAMPRFSYSVVLVAVIVTFTGAFGVQTSGILTRWDETGALRDAEAMTRYLRDEQGLHSDDAILCIGLCDMILRYYFDREGVDPTPLAADLNSAALEGRRIFVIYPQIHTLDGISQRPVNQLVLNRLSETARERVGGLALLTRFPQADLYRLDVLPIG